MQVYVVLALYLPNFNFKTLLRSLLFLHHSWFVGATPGPELSTVLKGMVLNVPSVFLRNFSLILLISGRKSRVLYSFVNDRMPKHGHFRGF